MDGSADRQTRTTGGTWLPTAEKPAVTVVIPTLNEAKNLPHVLPRIPAWIEEIIIVDGRSTDDTVEVAKTLNPDIIVLFEKRRGKGAALRCGFEAARGDIIVTLDADGSADPAEIPLFVGALLGGADFVKGSRFIQGGETDDMEWYRRLGNWGFVQLVKIAFGGKYTDLCYGYNAFWRDVLPLFNIEANDGFEIETSMNVQALLANLAVSEIPSKEASRLNGLSNLRTIPDGWRVLTTIARLSFSRTSIRSGARDLIRARTASKRLPVRHSLESR